MIRIWGWTGRRQKEALQEGGQNAGQKNNGELSAKMACWILFYQAKIAAYLNSRVAGKSVRQIKLLVLCFVIVVGSYCVYLIWEAVSAFI